MSSEEFEKLQEIYKSLYDEMKLMPERVLKSSGGIMAQLWQPATVLSKSQLSSKYN